MAPKKQAQKMSLGDFLGDQSLGSWADEMEDSPLSGPTASYGGSRPSFGGGGSFGGGFERGPDRGGFATREELPLPSKPPYTAHLGNLSFDATEGDIQDFFMDCDVTSVRVVEDKLDRKPKGFGYVEFGTLDGLKKALALSGTQFQGRNIRVSVAEPPKDRQDTRVFDDWTRKGPLPPIAGERPRGGGGFRSFDSGASDAGSDRGGRTRDFGTWERRGPLSPSNPTPSEPRKSSPSWGEGRSEESRPARREFSETRPPREPTAPELDNKWRDRMRPVETIKSPTGTPEGSSPSSPVAKPAAPAGRPRLNLQKRTVSESPAAPTASGGGDAKASPFGAARPIDTAAKEREIEEKRQLALRQKKESDEKAREEKRAKEAAAKTEKAAAPEGESENGAGSSAPASNFEVLESEETGEGATEEDANGTIVDDKAVKPKEVVRDAKPAESSWRRKESAPAAEEGSATQELEDDGWSTVPAKAKNSRRGGSRAIAS
ncbi:Eukaryotic translation initiation factor 4B [Diplodia intermedia]|uniref:Eukaryotic translation initiation factor 4B n=1 Tax=Diplodia intermedia TaxID=856260 RepID=A0ABR3TBW8_9PEZI